MTKLHKPGALVAAALLTVAVVIVVAAIILVPVWIKPSLSAAELNTVPSGQIRITLQQAQAQLQNSIRATLLQGLGGLLVVTGALATWRQVHVSREGQITERFTRAVDQLGSQNADVRIGGLYALERIARNSPADRKAIQYLLGAFVRNHATWPAGAPDGPQHPTEAVDGQLSWMTVRAPDIQAAASILGRLPPSGDAKMLYLSRTDLRGIQLGGADLTGTQLRHTNLARAQLQGTRLDECDLTDTDLRQANLEHARLTRANLTSAYLQHANLRHADLTQADLRGTSLTGATLTGTVLTGARADTTTTWPAGLDAARRRELGITEPGNQTPDPTPPAPA